MCSIVSSVSINLFYCTCLSHLWNMYTNYPIAFNDASHTTGPTTTWYYQQLGHLKHRES